MPLQVRQVVQVLERITHQLDERVRRQGWNSDRTTSEPIAL
jgi:hypothetical protein